MLNKIFIPEMKDIPLEKLAEVAKEVKNLANMKPTSDGQRNARELNKIVELRTITLLNSSMYSAEREYLVEEFCSNIDPGYPDLTKDRKLKLSSFYYSSNGLRKH